MNLYISRIMIDRKSKETSSQLSIDDCVVNATIAVRMQQRDKTGIFDQQHDIAVWKEKQYCDVIVHTCLFESCTFVSRKG